MNVLDIVISEIYPKLVSQLNPKSYFQPFFRSSLVTYNQVHDRNLCEGCDFDPQNPLLYLITNNITYLIDNMPKKFIKNLMNSLGVHRLQTPMYICKDFRFYIILGYSECHLRFILLNHRLITSRHRMMIWHNLTATKLMVCKSIKHRVYDT